MMNIPKPLLIGGGIAAVLGIGGGMLLANSGDKPKADDANPKDPAAPSPAEGGAGAATAAATGQAGGFPGLASQVATAGQGTPPQGGQGGAAGTAGGEQVGPYTLLPHESGMTVVVETATQQPVGVMDPQGNVTPVTVDATGTLVPVQEAPTTQTMQAPAGQVLPQGNVVPQGTTQAGIPGANADGYAKVAAALFANASNGTTGAATSDAMAGTAALTQVNAGAQQAVGVQPQVQPQMQTLVQPQMQTLVQPQVQPLSQAQVPAPQSTNVAPTVTGAGMAPTGGLPIGVAPGA